MHNYCMDLQRLFGSESEIIQELQHRLNGLPIHRISTERCTTSRAQVEKQKLESVENIPTFLIRSDIGQFVTCDELILPWRRRGGGSNHVWFVPG